MKKLSGIILFGACCHFFLDAAPSVILSDAEDAPGLAGHLEVFRDERRMYGVDEIMSLYANLPFLDLREDYAVYGYSDDDFWVTFSIDNVSGREKELLLEEFYTLLNTINVYHVQGSVLLSAVETGNAKPFASRDVEDPSFIFRLNIPPGESRVFVKVRTAGSVVVKLSLRSEDRLYGLLQRRNTLYGVHYGLLTIALVISLIIFTSSRDRSFLYYSLYFLSELMFIASYNGVTFQYLWPNNPILAERSTIFFVAVSFLAINTFVPAFLRVKKRNRWVYASFRFSRWLYAIFAVSVMISPNYSIITRIITTCVVFSNLGVFILGAAKLISGFRPARFFMSAWLVLLVGITMAVLRNFGLLPATAFTNSTMQIGSAIEVVLLLLALADRFNSVRIKQRKLNRDSLRDRQRMLDQQMRYTRSFSRFVPHSFLRLLEKEDILEVEAGDCVECTLPVLFSDIRSFTAMSEQMGLSDNYRFINAYLDRMYPNIAGYDGFIDKFIGDAIMALYTGERAAENSVRSGIAMLKTLKTYNRERATHGRPPIIIGIGINSGTSMLGVVGSEKRLNATVVSDVVNIASRLESLCKVYGVQLLVTDKILKALSDPGMFNTRFLGSMAMRGKKKKIEVYEVFDADDEQLAQRKKAHAREFHEILQGISDERFTETSARLEQYRKSVPDDQALSFLRKALHAKAGTQPGSPSEEIPNRRAADLGALDPV